MATTKETKRTRSINVELPADVHHALKVACAVRGVTFSEAVTEAVREWAKRQKVAS